MKTLTLVVDNLAANSFVAEHLKNRGVRIVESNLKFGQYRVTDQCTIWHLSAAELARMTADRTIYRKIPEFKRSAAEPIVIVEGDPKTGQEKISPTAMRAAFTFLALHNRIPLLTAADATEAAELVYFMVSQAQNGMGLTVSEPPAEEPAPSDSGSNGGNGLLPTDPIELQEYMLRAVPDINAATAKAMLEKFGSLRAIFAASAKDLTALPGIGPKRAKKIAAFFAGAED